jgi:DNA repair protein RadD
VALDQRAGNREGGDMIKTLHPHQARALDMLRESVRVKKTRVVLQAPTGWGKTVVAAKIIESARAKGNRVWFWVDAIALVEQSVRALWAEGIRDIGVLQGYHSMSDYTAPVQVISDRTLQNRNLEDLIKPDVVVIDECHRQSALVKRLIEEWPEVVFIGLSATPWAKGMGRYWNNLVISATTEDLIRLKFLKPFRAFAPSHPDLTGVKVGMTSHGKDFAEGELSEAMQKGSLTGDIISTWLLRGENRPTLCFGVDCAHAMALHREFERQGIASAFQEGGTPSGERERIRIGFANGSIKVVCNIGTLTTGIDWRVGCIILARPTKSEILFTQIIGRGLRQDGEPDLIILDHSDTTENLGFVTDISHAKLDDGTPAKTGANDKQKLRPPRECPKCTALFPRFARLCAECGFQPALQPREIETVEGDLVELDGNKRNKTASWEEKIAFIAGLRAYQREKGMKDGWVAFKYKARFGVWPNDARVRNAPAAVECDPYIRSWIRSQAIRFAKSKDRESAAA